MRTLMQSTARAVTALITVTLIPAHAQNQPAQEQPAAARAKFNSPQEAADALIKATQDNNLPVLMQIFGPESTELIASTDVPRQKSNADAFAAMAHQKKTVTVDPKNHNRAILTVGNEDWPLPIPIVKKDGKWYFDSAAGLDEILFRRIGANELDAIQICLGYVEAQKEYASEIRDNSGVHQYAQKIMSSPGKQDGLYWKNDDGTPGGPISEAVARAIEEGYTLTAASRYHGYYFRVLRGQGPAAPLGQMDFVIDGVMIGGFALAAVPAEYRVSGVKTFIVSHDGIVYEKDMGPDTLKIAKSMDRYNPDNTWHRTNDQWPPNAWTSPPASVQK